MYAPLRMQFWIVARHNSSVALRKRPVFLLSRSSDGLSHYYLQVLSLVKTFCTREMGRGNRLLRGVRPRFWS